MKTIKYTETQVGYVPGKPLCDINTDDHNWLLGELVRSMGVFSVAGQGKDPALWTDLTKRRPKTFSRGKSGANSIFTICAGLLANHWENIKKYGTCRLSRPQMDDLETAFRCLHCIDPTFEVIRFQQSVLSIGGVDV